MNLYTYIIHYVVYMSCYQLCYVDPGIASLEEMEQLKDINNDSILVRFQVPGEYENQPCLSLFIYVNNKDVLGNLDH